MLLVVVVVVSGGGTSSIVFGDQNLMCANTIDGKETLVHARLLTS